MSEFGSSRKRRLLDTSSLSFASPASSVKSLKSAADLDELKLANEQLQDELRSVRDDFNRAKEKHARQIEFLEEENENMKKATSEAKERYYEEKKKWQAKIREANRNASNTSISFSATPSSTKKTAQASSIAFDDSESDQWTDRLEALEKDVKSRAEKANALAKENAELKKTVTELKRASAFNNKENDVETTAEYRLEARELRKQVGDLEMSLRRKSRELERLQAKVQNQSLLEEELSAANNKNLTMTSAVESAKSIEADYRAMLEERKTWSVVLKDTLRGMKGLDNSETKASNAASVAGMGEQGDIEFEGLLLEHTNGNGDVSPMALLKAFSAAQRKVALLMKEKGDYASQMTHMKQQLERKREIERKEKGARSAEEKAMEEARSDASKAKKQLSLYEGELKSLRGLIKSFDSEFSMGKRPSKEDFIQVKNSIIDQLRSEVDTLRAQAQAKATASPEADAGTNPESLTSSSSSLASHSQVNHNKAKIRGDSIAEQPIGAATKDVECDELRSQVARLNEELREIKAVSGLDYIPGRTRVLHLKANPVLQAAAAKGTGAVEAYHRTKASSSLPRDALKAAMNKLRDMREAAKGPENNTDITRDGSNKQVAELSATPAAPLALDSTKLNLRLKELFKDRITTFREAVYLLTGWKIDMIFENGSKDGAASKPQLRLRSMYAESPEDSLLFQWTEENKLNLVETPFARKMDPKLLQSLQTLNSVPIFLGAVASDLFELQTVM